MVSAQSFCTIYIHNGSIVQGIERRFPKPQIRVRVAVELQQRGCRNAKLGSPCCIDTSWSTIVPLRSLCG